MSVEEAAVSEQQGEVVPFRAPRQRGTKKGLSEGAVAGIDLGEAGSAEVVLIDKVQVDPDYQRDLRHDLIAKIARNYDIVKAGAILLSERADHSLWCVDGQHRMIGAQQAGETEIIAHVVHGLTQAQEAELRLARNDRKSDTQQEKWQSRLVMGDPKAYAITEIVEQHGAEINIQPVSYRGINAIATLEMIYDVDGTGVWLGRVLKTLQDAYTDPDFDGSPDAAPRIDPNNASTSMLKAVCWFLGQHVDHREATYAEFVQRLRQVGVEDIRRKAISHKAANGGALWLNYYRAMVEMWNFRRSDAKKLRWKTIGSIAQLGTASTRKDAWSAPGVRDRTGGGR